MPDESVLGVARATVVVADGTVDVTSFSAAVDPLEPLHPARTNARPKTIVATGRIEATQFPFRARA